MTAASPAKLPAGRPRESPLKQILLIVHCPAAFVLGIVWGFAGLPPAALAAPVIALSASVAWAIGRPPQPRRALIGALVFLLLFDVPAAFVPAMILNAVRS
jgi:hypothetical protein